jgi:hypothetical protein
LESKILRQVYEMCRELGVAKEVESLSAQAEESRYTVPRFEEFRLENLHPTQSLNRPR